MTNIMLPYGAGSATPEKGEALSRDESAQGFKGQGSTDNPDCAEDLAQRKEQARLGAHLARKGYSLHELAGGAFLIARWDRTAHCSDLRAVAGFLRRIGGQ